MRNLAVAVAKEANSDLALLWDCTIILLTPLVWLSTKGGKRVALLVGEMLREVLRGSEVAYMDRRRTDAWKRPICSVTFLELSL